jgi:TolB-like protein
MLRKICSIALILIPLGSLAFALPQVAVLKTSVAAGIDPTVESAITGKIEEALVNSGRFQVLDRVSVDQVLKEKEFQLASGIVSESQMRQAGEYLGADFVAVATVTRVGQTFTLSAKMINVTTGQIAVQASADRQGTIDVVLALASEVAGKLAGAVVTAAADDSNTRNQPVSVPTESPAPEFYRNSVGLEFVMMGNIWPTIGGHYVFRFNELFGVMAGIGYLSNTFQGSLGAVITTFRWLEIGGRVVYLYDFAYDPTSTYNTRTYYLGGQLIALISIGRFEVGLNFGITLDAMYPIFGLSLGGSF